VFLTLFTIGHSTRTIAEFVAMLQQVTVDWVIDVRSIPRSRTNPQFNSASLSGSLLDAGITYRHSPALGGRRHRQRGAMPSANTGWRNESFRNYADYAATDAFSAGFEELRTLIRAHCCAIMCAEALWWRCHRRIIADYRARKDCDLECSCIWPGERRGAPRSASPESVNSISLRVAAA
jgi:uncharacterized protein (DUF488 family)